MAKDTKVTKFNQSHLDDDSNNNNNNEGESTMKTKNTKNDYQKHVEAFERHFEAIGGDKWDELTARELCKLLAYHTRGLNGGTFDRVQDAAERIGFDGSNIVPVSDNSLQVLTLIEFVPSQASSVQ